MIASLILYVSIYRANWKPLAYMTSNSKGQQLRCKNIADGAAARGQRRYETGERPRKFVFPFFFLNDNILMHVFFIDDFDEC